MPSGSTGSSAAPPAPAESRPAQHWCHRRASYDPRPSTTGLRWSTGGLPSSGGEPLSLRQAPQIAANPRKTAKPPNPKRDPRPPAWRGCGRRFQPAGPRRRPAAAARSFRGGKGSGGDTAGAGRDRDRHRDRQRGRGERRLRRHDLPGAGRVRQRPALRPSRCHGAHLCGHQAGRRPAAAGRGDHPAVREEGLQAAGAEAAAGLGGAAEGALRRPAGPALLRAAGEVHELGARGRHGLAGPGCGQDGSYDDRGD